MQSLNLLNKFNFIFFIFFLITNNQSQAIEAYPTKIYAINENNISECTGTIIKDYNNKCRILTNNHCTFNAKKIELEIFEIPNLKNIFNISETNFLTSQFVSFKESTQVIKYSIINDLAELYELKNSKFKEICSQISQMKPTPSEEIIKKNEQLLSTGIIKNHIYLSISGLYKASYNSHSIKNKNYLISKIDTYFNEFSHFLEINDLKISSGFSGGPVVDSNYNFIGINKSFTKNGEEIAYIIPSEIIYTFLSTSENQIINESFLNLEMNLLSLSNSRKESGNGRADGGDKITLSNPTLNNSKVIDIINKSTKFSDLSLHHNSKINSKKWLASQLYTFSPLDIAESIDFFKMPNEGYSFANIKIFGYKNHSIDGIEDFLKIKNMNSFDQKDLIIGFEDQNYFLNTQFLKTFFDRINGSYNSEKNKYTDHNNDRSYFYLQNKVETSSIFIKNNFKVCTGTTHVNIDSNQNTLSISRHLNKIVSRYHSKNDLTLNFEEDFVFKFSFSIDYKIIYLNQINTSNIKLNFKCSNNNYLKLICEDIKNKVVLNFHLAQPNQLNLSMARVITSPQGEISILSNHAKTYKVND